MNTLTIIILAVIVVSAIIGHRKGFVKMLLSLFSLVITLYIASLVSPAISGLLKDGPLYDSVYDSTYDYVSTQLAGNSAATVDALLDNMQLPEIMKNYISNSEVVVNGAQSIAASVAAQITDIIFDALVFLLTFFAAMIIVKLIFAAINIITYLPGIHGINKTAGLIAGVAEGLLLVWIFFIVVSMLGSTEFALKIYAQINESAILQWLYNKNIIMNLLFG